MTADDFRRIACSLPGANESSHMDHPDFRVGKRVFATLWPDRGHGVVMLTPEQQRILTAAQADVFAPVAGGWGVKGATIVRYALASEAAVHGALLMAWENKAPRTLLAERG